MAIVLRDPELEAIIEETRERAGHATGAKTLRAIVREWATERGHLPAALPGPPAPARKGRGRPPRQKAG